MDVTTPQLIICGRGKRGKALTNAIIRSLRLHGVANVAALSAVGVEHVARVGQAVANSMGVSVSADPRREEIELAPGVRKLALVVKFSVSNGISVGGVEALSTLPGDQDEVSAIERTETGETLIDESR